MFQETFIACSPDINFWEYFPAVQAILEYEDGHIEQVPFLID